MDEECELHKELCLDPFARRDLSEKTVRMSIVTTLSTAICRGSGKVMAKGEYEDSILRLKEIK